MKMQTRRFLTLGVVALALMSVNACRKKGPATGENPGTTAVDPPDTATAIPDRKLPDSPPLDRTLNQDEIGGPLADVYFDFDRYDIRADQRATLEGNATWLSSNSAQTVTIEGHCDERGTEEYNLALSDRRANATRSYLQTLGIAADRMSTIPYGKSYPVDPRHNEEAWAKNRRAHFVMGKNKGR